MRTNVAAVAVVAIASSFNVVDPVYGSPTKNGKAGKSDGADCTYCSVDTLTRATMVTNLFFGNLGDENGDIITQASIADFCNEGPDATEEFLMAGNNTAGCLVYFKCGFQNLVNFVYSGENITLSEGKVWDINGLCYAEQNDIIVPEGGCNYTDPCEAISNGSGGDGLLGDIRLTGTGFGSIWIGNLY